jgi:hypothetical protein
MFRKFYPTWSVRGHVRAGSEYLCPILFTECAIDIGAIGSEPGPRHDCRLYVTWL